MKATTILQALILALPFLAGSASGQDSADEVTIDVLTDPADTPDHVTREIRLPESRGEAAQVPAQQGLDTANEARQKRREFGRQRGHEPRDDRNEHRPGTDSVPAGDRRP